MMFAIPATRRVAIPVVLVWLLAITLFLVYRRNPDLFILNTKLPEGGSVQEAVATQRCGGDNYDPARVAIWEGAKLKYAALMDDKFTIAISTYHRPKELNDTLAALLSSKVPSLHEIVVLWGNIGEEPPPNFTSTHGVAVRYRVKSRNSLNEKLLPDPNYRTRAILLSDDDLYFEAPDLEFAFQAWRRFGRGRVTGGLGRCCSPDSAGDKLVYNFCENREHYNLVLTDLAFADVAFLDVYSSSDPLMSRVRDHVDELFNCEDLAFNFVVSSLTCEGPLLVRGAKPFVNFDPQVGLSRNGGHMEKRHECLNFFRDAFGYVPLVDQVGHMQRGIGAYQS